jgi:hypothetical protein
MPVGHAKEPVGPAILEALGAAVSVGSAIKKRNIKRDEIKQTSNALGGLDPDPEATAEGKMAHSMVGMQNNIARSNARLRLASKSFTGTDAEFDDMIADEFETTRQGWLGENSDASVSDVSNGTERLNHLFQSSLPQLMANRDMDKINIEHTQRVNTLDERMASVASAPEGQGASQVAMIMREGVAMGLSQNEAQDRAIEFGVSEGKQGRVAVIDWAKETKNKDGVSLFDRSKKLQGAQNTANRFNVQRKAGTVAEQKIGLESTYEANLDPDQLYKLADKQNKEHGTQVHSPAYIAGIIRKGQVNLSKKTDDDRAANLFLMANQEGRDGLNHITGNAAMRKKGMTGAKKILLERAEDAKAEMRETGELTPEVEDSIDKSSRDVYHSLLEANSATDPEYKAQITTLLRTDMSVVNEDGDLGDSAESTMELWNSMSDNMKVAHTSPKDLAAMSVFDAHYEATGSMSDAVVAAQKAKNEPRVIDKSVREDLASEVRSIDTVDHSAGGMMFNTQSSAVTERRAEMVEDLALQFYKGGATAEGSAELAQKTLDRNWTNTESGHLIDMPTNDLLAATELNNKDDLNQALDVYLDLHEKQLLSGGDYDKENLYFEVGKSRSTFTINDAVTGRPVSRPAPLSDIKVGRDGFLERQSWAEDGSRTDRRGRARLTRHQQDRKKAGRSILTAVDSEQAVGVERDFNQAMRGVENGVGAGYDRGANVFTPHESVEGGTATLGFGYKLSKKEMKQGYIEHRGNTLSFKEGQSEITVDIANDIMSDKLKDADQSLTQSVKGYADYPIEYQKILQSIQYNTGDVSDKTWPKLIDAMNNRRDKDVRKEMVTKYTDPSGNEDRLTERAMHLADALKLKK